jgi:hypothetical protein
MFFLSPSLLRSLSWPYDLLPLPHLPDLFILTYSIYLFQIPVRVWMVLLVVGEAAGSCAAAFASALATPP